MLKLIKWGLMLFVGAIVLLGVADGIRNLSETNEETFQRHLKANHLDSAEDLLKKNPNLQIDGRKGLDLLAEKKAALEAEQIAKEIAEAERLAKEKAEAEKKAAEQLVLAQSKGYATYDEYRASEANKQVVKENPVNKNSSLLFDHQFTTPNNSNNYKSRIIVNQKCSISRSVDEFRLSIGSDVRYSIYNRNISDEKGYTKIAEYERRECNDSKYQPWERCRFVLKCERNVQCFENQYDYPLDMKKKLERPNSNSESFTFEDDFQNNPNLINEFEAALQKCGAIKID